MEANGASLFSAQLRVLRGLHYAQACARGLCGVVEIWLNILGYIGPGCPRSMVPHKDAFKSFICVLAWHIGGKIYPRSTARLLEILFDGQWQKLPLGLKQGKHHPFAEPIRQTDVLGQQGWNAIRRETAMCARRRRAQLLRQACEQFHTWTRMERFFFMARVVFWDSNWPSHRRTDPGISTRSKAPDQGEREVSVKQIPFHEEEDLYGDPLQQDDAISADLRYDEIVTPAGSQIAAQEEQDNEEHERFEGVGEHMGVRMLDLPTRLPFENVVPERTSADVPTLPCLGDPSLHARRQKLVDAVEKSKRIPLSNKVRMRDIRSQHLRDGCRDLAVLCMKGKKILFKDPMFGFVEMWRNIIQGKAALQVANECVVAGEFLQAAASHEAIFGDIMVPKTAEAAFVPGAESILRQSRWGTTEVDCFTCDKVP